MKVCSLPLLLCGAAFAPAASIDCFTGPAAFSTNPQVTCGPLTVGFSQGFVKPHTGSPEAFDQSSGFLLLSVALGDAGLPGQYVEVTVSVPGGDLSGFNFSLDGWTRRGGVGFPDSTNPFPPNTPEWLEWLGRQPYMALTVCAQPLSDPPSSWLSCVSGTALAFVAQGLQPIEPFDAVQAVDPAGPGETGQGFLTFDQTLGVALANQITLPGRTGRLVTNATDLSFRIFEPPAVPEASTFSLTALGLAVAVGMVRRWVR